MSAVDGLKITSVAGLLEVLEVSRSILDRRDPWYRGQACFDWTLLPHVYRIFETDDTDQVSEQQRHSIVRDRERKLYRRFRDRARALNQDCPHDDDETEWLPFMRHYQLPTRLLDWTESPLVAAYFAVRESKYEEEEGAFWVLDPCSLNDSQIGVPLPLGAEDEHIWQIMQGVTEEEFGGAKDALAVTLPELFIRMAVQRTCYTIHKPIIDLTLLTKADEFLVKYSIPAKYKRRIKEDLAKLAVTRVALFPDLDNLAIDLLEREGFAGTSLPPSARHS